MDIFELLKSVKTNPEDRKSVNLLVEKSYIISLYYVKLNARKVFRQLKLEGETFEEMSIESIAPLFVYTADKQLQIIKSYEKWASAIKNEEDALYFLNKIISRRVNQHIAHILKKTDPFFAKIYDSINYLIKKDNYKKQSYFGTVFIVKNKISGKTIDNSAFEQLPFKLFTSKDELIRNILNFLKDETQYYPAIPINALVKKIKLISFEEYVKINDSPNHLIKYELKETVDAGLNNAFEKLNYSYSHNNKLNCKEVESFKLALNDIAIDLKDGGIKPGLFEYLGYHMPELEKELFKSKYQNILEYLLKIMKKKVAEELMK